MREVDMSTETTAGSPRLRVAALTKHYSGVVALDDVSLSVKEAETVAVMGDNGAGKSTLMKCIAGAIIPDGGTIAFDGDEVSFRHPRDARALGIEAVYQDLALVVDLDVTANLFLGREELRGRGPLGVLQDRPMNKRARELMSELGIKLASLRTPVGRLSGGQQQGVAIARAIGWGTKVVILDEPTAALGVRERRNVWDLVERLADKGISILLVSHNMEEVFRLCDRVCVLRHGAFVGERVIADTSGEEIVGLITGTANITSRG